MHEKENGNRTRKHGDAIVRIEGEDIENKSRLLRSGVRRRRCSKMSIVWREREILLNRFAVRDIECDDGGSR
jgi:hypothetical protein